MSSSLFTVHEERLGRVDESLGALQVETAINNNRLESVENRLCGLETSVKDGFSDLSSRFTVVEAESKRWSALKKIVTALFLTALGGAAAKLGEYLFSIWGK